MAGHDELKIEKETLTGKGIPVLILYGAINVSTFDKLEKAIQERSNTSHPQAPAC
jgi:hypothetical protein